MIADDRGEGTEQLIVFGVRSEVLYASFEISCGRWPLVAVDQTGEMSALQPQTAFQSITPMTGRYAVQLVERLGEMSPGLGECAAPTCSGAAVR